MNILRYLMEPDADPPTLEEYRRTGGYSQIPGLSKPSVDVPLFPGTGGQPGNLLILL